MKLKFTNWANPRLTHSTKISRFHHTEQSVKTPKDRNPQIIKLSKHPFSKKKNFRWTKKNEIQYLLLWIWLIAQPFCLLNKLQVISDKGRLLEKAHNNQFELVI